MTLKTRKAHNEYVLPVMVYGSETWALKKVSFLIDDVPHRRAPLRRGPYRRVTIDQTPNNRQLLFVIDVGWLEGIYICI